MRDLTRNLIMEFDMTALPVTLLRASLAEFKHVKRLVAFLNGYGTINELFADHDQIADAAMEAFLKTYGRKVTVYVVNPRKYLRSDTPGVDPRDRVFFKNLINESVIVRDDYFRRIKRWALPLPWDWDQEYDECDRCLLLATVAENGAILSTARIIFPNNETPEALDFKQVSGWPQLSEMQRLAAAYKYVQGAGLYLFDRQSSFPPSDHRSSLLHLAREMISGNIATLERFAVSPRLKFSCGKDKLRLALFDLIAILPIEAAFFHCRTAFNMQKGLFSTDPALLKTLSLLFAPTFEVLWSNPESKFDKEGHPIPDMAHMVLMDFDLYKTKVPADWYAFASVAKFVSEPAALDREIEFSNRNAKAPQARHFS
jgi:hypothetical protein